MRIYFLIILLNLMMVVGKGQDSLPVFKSKNINDRIFTPKSVGFSTACIGYGITALNSNSLKRWNEQVNNQVAVKNPYNKVHIDDYLVYSPGLLTLGLNLAGVKAQHVFKESILLYAITNATVTAIVVPVKYISKEQRPDQSSYNSFPSGHTSMAFASAEFARMEYKNRPWVGLLSYGMAVSTGYIRMYNNRHWFSDVVAGAGVGILSAKLSYWIFEKLNCKRKKRETAFIIHD